MKTPIVIPGIDAPTEQAVRDQLKRFAGLSPWIHLDIADGSFTPVSTWGSPTSWRTLVAEIPALAGVQLEVHLMVKHPELVVESWLAAGARRVIVHVETLADAEVVLDQCVAHRAGAMLAIAPGTAIAALEPYLTQFSAFQVLAVAPGRPGQALQPEVIPTIAFLRQRAPGATLEVDGGITPETIADCRRAGADTFISTSYLLAGADSASAYQRLVDALTAHA